MHKMQEYLLKGKRIYVGLEDSKRTWRVCVRYERMVMHETSMPAEYENLRTYFERHFPACAITVLYEAGFGGFWLHDALVADGWVCIVTPPHTVTEEKANKVKTDKRDARRLAQNVENGDYTACVVPDREWREDRQTSRTLEQVQKDLIRTKNRIRKVLDFHGLNAGLPAGRWSTARYYALRDLSVSAPLQASLAVHVALLAALDQQRAALQEHLHQLCTKARYAPLVASKASCPGIGWLTAIRLTLEWGSLLRFPSGKQLGSFTGLTAREYSTGERRWQGRITGQSAPAVRRWLLQCAWRAIRLDPVLQAKYRAVWSHSGSKKKAIVAVARKLAVRMRALELHNESYCIGLVE